MVKTGNTLWWPIAFILWHFPKVALPAGRQTGALKGPSTSQNTLFSFPGTPDTGFAPSFFLVLLTIFHFAGTCPERFCYGIGN
jgi:hypothetical protein